jgi:opacity protein-like surface antigen
MLIPALSAQAQKNEASFLVGGLKTGSRGIADAAGSSIDSGASVAYEINVATRLLNARLVSLYFELPLIVAPNTSLKSSNVLVPKSYSSIFFTPGLRLKASTMSPVSPYAVLGAGFGHFNSSGTLASGQPNQASRGATKLVYDVGGGVDLRLIPFVALRGEVRDLISGNPSFAVPVSGDRQHNVLFAGGVVLRF